MASRDLLRRMRRHPKLQGLALGTLESRDYLSHLMFNDAMKEEGVMRMGPWVEVGKTYFISTVTKYYTGEVVSVDCDFIVLKKAAWIPDTGRFHESMRDGTFSEVEPYPDNMEVAVAMNAIVDISDWSKHKLPRTAQ